MRRRPWRWMLLTGLLVYGGGLTAQAITVDFVPAVQQGLPGSALDVALRIADLGNGRAPSLGTFDLDVRFNPAVLTLTAVRFGDPTLGDQLDLLGLGRSTEQRVPAPGVARLFELSFDTVADLHTLQRPAFVLATLRFEATGAGTSRLDLPRLVLGDAQGNPLNATAGTGQVTVVPEPGTVFLLGTGVLGVLGYGWRRQVATRQQCNDLLERSGQASCV